MKIMVTSFKRSRACTDTLSAPDPAPGHCQPTPLLETPGHSWTLSGHTSLCQSLVGSLLLSPGSWCTRGFVCALQESVSPVLCKFWWLYGGVNGDLLQEGLCHTQVCCIQSPCPCGRPLLTHTSAGDTQTQFWLSLCGVSGSWCAQSLSEPPEHLWWVWGLIHHSYHLAGASLLPLDVGYLFWWDPHASIDSCLAASCNFGVLAGVMSSCPSPPSFYLF